MHILLPILIIGLFVYLYCLFLVAVDDPVFLRRGISNEQIFNIAFFLILASVLSARLSYVLLHFNPQFLNPIVFLAIPYFPGLTLYGGLLGGLLFLLIYLKMQRATYGRILDFFSFASFSSVGICSLLFHSVEFVRQRFFPNVFFPFLFIVVFGLLTYLFLPRVKRGQAKEGSLSFLYLFSFSLIYLVFEATAKSEKLFLFVSRDSLLLFITIIIALSFWLKQLMVKKEKEISSQ